jgi:hypothetical protein
VSRNCCRVCPNRPTCQEIEDFLFVVPDDIISREDREMIRPPNPICQACFTELPASGVCGVCD